MIYEEFEWHILRLVYEDGLDRLHPSQLAYTLGLSHEEVHQHLEQAAEQGVVELDLAAQGRLEYYIPGVDRDKLPVPLWKQQAQQDQPPPSPLKEQPERAFVIETTATATSAPSVTPGRRPTDGSTIQAHVHGRSDQTDGFARQSSAVVAAVHNPSALVIARHATPTDHDSPQPQGMQTGASTAMVPYQGSGALLQIEASGDALCDPSQTIFMRKLRVHGVQSEALLRDHIQRLFESFGYKQLSQTQEKMRFERGSVTFILALVPLFVLILPLFVYLFLYCMGRSTIQQEPLALDVHIKRSEQSETTYEIDLFFIGLHGVVLGSSDQRVLNQEIDTLREELRWALAGP